MRYVTIGAGGSIGGLAGTLASDLNREKDVDLTSKVQLITFTEDGLIDVQTIGKLLALEEHYNTKEHHPIYNAFPDFIPFAYNSNSFISGLLSAAGFKDVTKPDKTVPGWDKPLPKQNFNNIANRWVESKTGYDV